MAIKKTYWAWGLVFLHIVLNLPAQAQQNPTSSTGALLFWADQATFARTDSLVYQEIYLQIYCRDFDFKNSDTLQEATYQLKATLQDSQDHVPPIFNAEGTPLKQLQWTQTLRADIDTDIYDQVAIETFAFQTVPGQYTLHLTLQDLISKKNATSSMSLNIPKPSQTIRLSDIQLGRRIDESPTHNRVLKNGIWVVPNVTHTLSTQEKVLPFYFEIYNLKGGTKNTFDLAYSLLDEQNKPVKIYTSSRYKKPGTTSVKTENLELPALTPGHYTLKITIRDTDTRTMAIGQKTFLITNPTQNTLATDAASLQRYYNQIHHLATKSEREQYNGLSPIEKVAFILQFWKGKDPTPNTPENEFAAEHFRRMHYVTQSFPSRPKQLATNTDQGRVYIVYGPPTDIERNQFNAIGKDYEIWTYEHLNYYQFVFLDRLGDSVLELVHATMPGERYNPNWREEQIIGDPADPMAPPTDAFGSPAP